MAGHPSRAKTLALLLLLAGAASPCVAQLRVATWNVTNYNGTGREQAFKDSIYGSFQGRRMSPDVLICQEFLSQSAANAFRTILNSAPGSPGDWHAAPFINGPDSDSAFFYRSSRVTFLGSSIAVVGGDPEGPPRHVMRYDIRPAGYASESTVVACYSVHMKAGSSGSDQQRRLVEATAIRADAASLPPGWNFLIAGDFNIQSSSQAAFQHLIGSQSNNKGRSFDPIATVGSWNNSVEFRFVHTQAPGTGSAGMDDRLDMILLSDGISNGIDFSYIGTRSIPYSTETWNDPIHSYRAWGNDGTSFNTSISINNQMVGPTIAQALLDVTSVDNTGGHLPVFLDLRVPAKVSAPEIIDLGTLEPVSSTLRTLSVTNAADVGLWSAAGIANLVYSLEASPGIYAPAGPFVALPGASNDHIIAIDTATAGPIAGTITITSSSLEHPVRVVTITGEIAASCYPNCDGSTALPVLNVADFGCFLSKFASSESYANCDGSTSEPVLNVADFGCFLSKFAAGCR